VACPVADKDPRNVDIEVIARFNRTHLRKTPEALAFDGNCETLAGMPATAQCHQPRPGASGSKTVTANFAWLQAHRAMTTAANGCPLCSRFG